MAKIITPLSANQVKNAKPRDKLYKLSDGAGWLCGSTRRAGGVGSCRLCRMEGSRQFRWGGILIFRWPMRGNGGRRCAENGRTGKMLSIRRCGRILLLRRWRVIGLCVGRRGGLKSMPDRLCGILSGGFFRLSAILIFVKSGRRMWSAACV